MLAHCDVSVASVPVLLFLLAQCVASVDEEKVRLERESEWLAEQVRGQGPDAHVHIGDEVFLHACTRTYTHVTHLYMQSCTHTIITASIRSTFVGLLSSQ